MGLAFKPDIDDLRESPALYVTETLENQNFTVLAIEPNLKGSDDLNLTDYKEAINKADIIVYLVAHKEFINLKTNPNKSILDFCGVLKK
jgi:UDP-N-acetyl-D-mannosaminuronic acid dehydrogenase